MDKESAQDGLEKSVGTKTARPRNQSWLFNLCLWLIIASLLIAGIQSITFQPQGKTEAYFERQSNRRLAAPIEGLAISPTALDAPQPLNSVEVDIWFLPAPRVFSAEHIFAKRLERGRTTGGQVAYFIEFDEAGLNQYLNYWFGAWAKQNTHLRNAYMDLKPGGVIVYGEVDLGTRWQRAGAVFSLDESGRQFVFAGVDMAGELLAAPPYGPLTEGIKALTENGNRALRELRFIDPEGDLYIQQIVLSDNTAQIAAQRGD